MDRLLLIALCAVLAACSSSEDTSQPEAPIPDAGVEATADSAEVDSEATDAPVSDSEAADAVAEAPAEDASPVEAGNPFETCEGACAQTSLTVTLGGNKGTLDRAQFGFNAPSGGSQTIHMEAHFGGDTGCPSETSPTPDRTVVFGSVPIPSDTTPIEGTPVTLLDFEGSISSNPFDKATQVKLIPVAAKVSPPGSAFVAFDVEVEFAGGTLTGHVYATHCDSMDE